MFKLPLLIALSLLTITANSAFADCLSEDPTRVQSDAVSAITAELLGKNSLGLNLPALSSSDVRCNRPVNWIPFGSSLIDCSVNKSGRDGSSSYSIYCNARFKNCGTPSASCALQITQ